MTETDFTTVCYLHEGEEIAFHVYYDAIQRAERRQRLLVAALIVSVIVNVITALI
jgi:hypothetical protein